VGSQGHWGSPRRWAPPWGEVMGQDMSLRVGLAHHGGPRFATAFSWEKHKDFSWLVETHPV